MKAQSVVPDRSRVLFEVGFLLVMVSGPALATPPLAIVAALVGVGLIVWGSW